MADPHSHAHHEAHDHGHSAHDHGADHGHGHDHAHGPGGHHHHGAASERRLRISFVLLFAFTLVQAVGGFWSNSLALLAEAAHMFADSASLLLAIIAIRVARRPASAERTYGNHRYQTLAAYTNGLTLLGLTVWVMAEALQRLVNPPEVNGKVMLVVALVGGAANLAAFLVLSGASSLNEQGARAHVLSDLLGSGAAAAAAVVILLFGWLPADPLLSIAVSLLILRSGWQLTRDSAHVLLEGTPPGLDVRQVESELNGLPGIAGVHHLHAWSLTGEKPILTLHAQLAEGIERQGALTAILDRLRERFGIDHATVQIEEGGCAAPAGHDDCHSPALPAAGPVLPHAH